MRIAILYFADHVHGRRWAKALANTEAKVFLYSPTHAPAIENVTIRSLHLKTFRYPYLFRYLPTLKQWLKIDRIDVLHPILLTPFGTWARYSGFRPFVPMAIGIDVLNYWHTKNEKIFWESTFTHKLKFSILRFYYQWEILRTLKAAALVVSDTQYLLKVLPIKVTTYLARWGVFPEYYEVRSRLWQKMCATFGIDATKRLVLFPRGVRRFYGTHLFLAVLPSLIHTFPNVQWIIVRGSYTPDKDISSQLQKLLRQYPKQLCFINKDLSMEQMAQLWLHADAFISLAARDAFPVTLHEAFYSGTLPIVYAHEAYYEALHPQWHAPLVIKAYNEKALFQTICNALTLPQKEKQRLITYGKQWAQQHSNIYKNASNFIRQLQQKLF